MKYSVLRFISIVCALIISTGCDLLGPDEKNNEIAQTDGIYILCEGAYGTETSSLWGLDADFETLSANVFQSLTDKPLGDTGQSLYIDGEKIYVVVNGSQTMEVFRKCRQR